MNLILNVFGNDAYREVLLPSEENTDFYFHPDKQLLYSVINPTIKIENFKNIWRIVESDLYTLTTKEGDDCDGVLKDNSVLVLNFSTGEKLSISVTKKRYPITLYRKYSIKNLNRISVGRTGENDICYSGSKFISRIKHAFFSKQGDYWIVQDNSSNGLYINNVSVKGQRQLEFGDIVNIFGLKIVFLGDCIALNKDDETVVNTDKLKPYKSSEIKADFSGDGTIESSEKILFHRAPRHIISPDIEPVEIEAPPQPRQDGQRPAMLTIGPSLTMALPMLFGSIMTMTASRLGGGMGNSMFMLTGIVTAISSAVIGTFWATGSLKYEKKRAFEEEQHRREAYSSYIEKCNIKVRDKYQKNYECLHLMYPDAAECCGYREGYSQLWNRNPNHEDFASYRLGIGNIPMQAAIEIPKDKFTLVDDELAEGPSRIKNAYSTLKDVPINIDLIKHKFVGIVGGAERRGAREVLYNIIAQAATANCYTELKMIFLYDEEDRDSESFDFVRWLPHVWSGDKKVRYVACGKSESSDVLYELTNSLRMRMEGQTASSDKSIIPKPYYLLFVISPAMLEGEMIASYIGRQGDALGLSTIMLVERYEDLPNGCNYIIEKDSYFSGMYDVKDNIDKRIPIEFDEISLSQLSYLAKNLSNIEVSETESGGEMPTSLTFFDMFKIDRLEELRVVEKWLKNRTYDSMRALIGQKGGGVDCYLDVHEKYHGPHGLVAGTTGSGKSETLQTYILSLAINYSPDDIGFFLIDYKGGGMANLFDGLPHVIGQISNLSGNQVRRAMVSIKSENKRRQRVFNDNGVNNINNYTKLYKNGDASLPIPHMFIVIDEFAELKREEPEFMKELISVAQVGRSLGVHLILATQKPAGTVDDNIWSNSRFRLCLRVQDRQDSNDMLHRPDAAYITQAGRAYLQVGNDELFELFQSGYSGAVYDPEGGASRAESIRLISNTGKTALSGGRKKKKKETEGVNETTQLDAIVQYLGKVAKDNGYTNNLMLWLPLLPTMLYLKELPGYKIRFGPEGWKDFGNYSKGFEVKTLIGLYDDPVNQAQNSLELNFMENGHHLVVGMAGTGKSTFIQSVIYSLLCRYTPGEINIYGMDFSAKMMESFRKAPHIGGIVYEGEDERIAKFFTLIRQILKERKQLFKGGNYSQYVRVNGVALPAVLIFIDNFGAFRSKTKELYDEDINLLIKEGTSCGVYLMITAGGISMTEMPSRMADNIRTGIALEMADKYQYSDVVRSMRLEVIPEVNVKGRGLAWVGEQILEFQTALSVGAEDDFTRMQKLEKLAGIMSGLWKGKRARKIPEIPEKPVWNDFVEQDEYKTLLADDRSIPVGYDGDNASVYSINLALTYCYIISGKHRTGKTNYLKCIARSAAAKKSKMVYIDYGKELEKLHGDTGGTYVSNDVELFDFLNKLLPDFKERNRHKNDSMALVESDVELYDKMKDFSHVCIIVANIADFVNHVMFPEDGVANMSNFVENILDKGKYHNVFWFGCLSLEDVVQVAGIGAFNLFTRDGMGIHFGGNVSDQSLLNFDYIPFSEQGKSQKPGTGMIPNAEGEEDTYRVVVPLCK